MTGLVFLDGLAGLRLAPLQDADEVVQRARRLVEGFSSLDPPHRFLLEALPKRITRFTFPPAGIQPLEAIPDRHETFTEPDEFFRRSAHISRLPRNELLRVSAFA